MTQSCKYPNCCAPVSVEHKFCLPHNSWIRQNGLCCNCLRKKDQPDHRLCETCHRVETGQGRQIAIDAGLCTNYWKCKKTASRRGGMCTQCFSEYNKKFTPGAPPVPPVIPPQPPIIPPQPPVIPAQPPVIPK